MGHAMITTAHRRKGVLLLVVLSMLTLFMMLGTTYLVVSTRARKTARAFADNVAAGTTSGLNAQRMLDDAMMTVARGTTGTSAIPALRSGEDLLGDKYGKTPAEQGTISGAASGSAIIELPTAGLSNPHLLAGRVITFTMPTLTDVSTRILRADASGTLYIPGGQTVAGAPITATAINAAKQAATSTPHFIVNGREFAGGAGDTNEPYDAFPTTSGTSDPHLARVAIVSGSVVATPSFGVTAVNATIDNDSDGTPDSGWIDVGFPVITDLSGNAIKPKAAVLVIDLDGRLNVNAHGSRTDLENTAASSDLTEYTSGYSKTGQQGYRRTPYYPTLSIPTASGTTVFDIQSLPRGLGVGPAEIALFGPVIGGPKSTGLGEMLSGCPPDGSEVGATDKVTGRQRPIVGGPDGRYGSDKVAWCPRYNPDTVGTAKPGIANLDDNNDLDRWVSSSGTASPSRFFEDTNTRYGSPSDIKGRMRIWTDAFGQPVYYKPYWGAWDAASRRFADDDIIDDPYEINLGRLGPRTSAVHASATAAPPDSLFTPSDLEGVLRYFDPDSMRLPRRLMAICRDWASAARPLVTTESWDTPAVTGTAWNDVVASQYAALLQSPSAQDFFSPETIMGHKFDLNRPFHDTDVTEPNDPTGIARRQQFAKHLYCLLVAIFQKNSNAAPTSIQAEQLAQWAVNVVDFRDADSIMTPFDYDETFAAGSTSWNASKRVWGVERPEILITETLAWHDRKTDDTDVNNKVTESNQSQADQDFDQTSRPRGAFFVELYSPWGSQAKQYSAGSGIEDVAKSGTSAPAYRGEPLPSELVTGSTSTTRFERTATLNLGRTHSGTGNTTTSGTGSPVWRLVTVRGDVKNGKAFGTDPFATGTSGTTSWIVDPSRQGSTASIDRIFYFTVPPSAQRSEKEGAVFWQSGSSQAASAKAQPSQSRYVIVGTDRLVFDYTDSTYLSVSGSNPKVDRCFDQPALKPATISEPLWLDDSTVDAYWKLLPNGKKFTPDDAAVTNNPEKLYDQQLNPANAVDQPLDSRTSHPASVSLPFLDQSGNPLLMQNGTHENFAVVHLQRLADPTKAWDSTTNPYLTVDSLPVDLTVVNTANTTNNAINATAGTNYDEPNSPASAYRYESTERGGKTTDTGATANESDIWNRRVNASTGANSLTNPDAFRTPSVAPRAAQTIDPLPPLSPPAGQSYKLRASPATLGSMTLVSGTSNATTTTPTAKPSRFPSTRFPWLFWANRPFTSAAELALVPTPNAFRLLAQHTTATGTSSGSWAAGTRPFNHLCGLFETGTTPPEPWKSVIGTSGTGGKPGVLDFLHVPSRFTGAYLTVSASTTNASTLGLDKFPINQISQFREPGRVNVNTLAMSSVWGSSTTTTGTSWNPLFGRVTIGTASAAETSPFLGMTTSGSSAVSGTFTSSPPFSPPAWNNEQAPMNPFASGTSGPATTLFTVLDRIGRDSADNTGAWPAEVRALRDHGKDAYFRYEMGTRMANMVTTRSNVYAVWITIGYFDAAGNEIQPVRRSRGFYIFDRSVPVGYETGKDHNVRDAILLRRIIQ